PGMTNGAMHRARARLPPIRQLAIPREKRSCYGHDGRTIRSGTKRTGGKRRRARPCAALDAPGAGAVTTGRPRGGLGTHCLARFLEWKTGAAADENLRDHRKSERLNS